jgi:hypothetical protein
MTWRSSAIGDDFKVCRWVSRLEALRHFSLYGGSTQSQEHIKPLHWYVACRLVIEGGFHPDDIRPRPPFVVTSTRGRHSLHFDASKAEGGERTVLGGLKTKSVDVVVTKDGLGPVLSISCKSMTGALRNLTNRMEETIGECTNLHITYPAMVFGYLFVLRANREVEAAAALLAPTDAEPEEALKDNDIAIELGGKPVESIMRFHNALAQITGRRGIRDDGSRYEAVSLALTETSTDSAGELFAGFPKDDSPLLFERFFQQLYLRYEERFLISAPDLARVTRRLEWAADSPALDRADFLNDLPELDYEPRIAAELDLPR